MFPPLLGVALLQYGFLGGVARGQTLSLVWSDEFNGASIDLTKWTFEIGNGADEGNPGWGNHELEYYTSNSANAYVTNGFLHIHAQSEVTSSDEGTFYYTSARMKTQGLYSKTYGRIEWRASLPQGTGFWPALWMLGVNIDGIGWPGCGEIDVVENNGTPNFEQGSIHSGSDATKKFLFSGTNSVTGFHVYDLDWTTNSIIWSVDGVGYETQTVWSSSTGNPYPFPFNQPFFFLMNMAVGGDYLGNPSMSSINPNMPGEMVIDYMRVYDYVAGPIVTNIVPFVLQPGVALNWPTIVSTNYQPQWTATLLSTSTPWSNLVSQITGNGTTNSMFDLFGSSPQKFYQVLQISGGAAQSNSANPILNQGFEVAGAAASNAANWIVDLAVNGPVYAVRTNDQPHGGSFNFEVHLASTGNGPAVEFNQSGLPVAGGTSYTLSFYADRLAGSAADVDEYNIQWLNSNSVVVASTGYTSCTPGANVYAQTVVKGLTAPAAATSANIFFHCAGGASPSLSATIDFDDISLTNSAAGGGTGVVTTNQVQAGIAQAVAVTWFASNGVPYQVQWSGDQINWNNLGNQITGSGTSNMVFDAAGQAGHSFYQVLSFQ
jgi:beta-glucanase (GH16 family)